MVFRAAVVSLFLVASANAQVIANGAGAPSASGSLYYNYQILTNLMASNATGLTHGMSNGSVRQFYLELDDATPAGANWNLTTAFTSHMVETGPSSGDKVGGIFNVYNCCSSGGGYILGGDS